MTGTLAKIATDVALMMQTEVAEAFEPFQQGRGSSSTMPQKRNPISCELILAAAKVVRSNAGLMLDAMAADHERATGPWHLEWVAIPEAFIAASGALRQARFMLEGLIVDPKRMRRNLDLTGGLIVAEAVMMALAEHTGRQVAHDIVYGACRAALDRGSTLIEELQRRPEVTRHLDQSARGAHQPRQLPGLGIGHDRPRAGPALKLVPCARKRGNHLLFSQTCIHLAACVLRPPTEGRCHGRMTMQKLARAWRVLRWSAPPQDGDIRGAASVTTRMRRHRREPVRPGQGHGPVAAPRRGRLRAPDCKGSCQQRSARASNSAQELLPHGR